MAIKSEERIQQECYNWFWNTYPNLRGLLFHVPNGGARSIQEGKMFKKIGVVAGVSDLIFLYKGNAYLFELKNEIGRQSEKQLAWQSKVTQQGFYYYIIRDLEKFKKEINLIIKNNV